MIDDWCGSLHYLVGFENVKKNGFKGMRFNFILSNGARSWQRDYKYRTDESCEYFTHMMPKDAHKKIKMVDIYFTVRDDGKNGKIGSFQFLDLY